MLPLVKLYLERAENEMTLAETVFKISFNSDLKKTFGLKVVRHSKFFCGLYIKKIRLDKLSDNFINNDNLMLSIDNKILTTENGN